jgi:hypothetical protein
VTGLSEQDLDIRRRAREFVDDLVQHEVETELAGGVLPAGRPLAVDIEEEVTTGLSGSRESRQGRAVAITVHLRPFGKGIASDHIGKCLRIDKVIVDAVYLPFAHRSGGVRDRMPQPRNDVNDFLAERGLPCPGGSGDDKKNTVTLQPLGSIRHFGSAHEFFPART